MQLTLREVSELLQLSEPQLLRWIKNDGLPAMKMNDRFRINTVELLEWICTHPDLPISVDRLRGTFGESNKQSGLAAALEAGGVLTEIGDEESQGILPDLIAALSLPSLVDREELAQLLLSRGMLGLVILDRGIAIPDAKQPIVERGVRSLLHIVYLPQSLEFPAQADKPIHTLFFIITPTANEHVALLGELTAALKHAEFSDLISRRAPVEELLSALRAVTASLETAALGTT